MYIAIILGFDRILLVNYLHLTHIILCKFFLLFSNFLLILQKNY